jgi:hypothetical protein
LTDSVETRSKFTGRSENLSEKNKVRNFGGTTGEEVDYFPYLEINLPLLAGNSRPSRRSL